MEEQLRKLRRSIRYYYILGLRKARPLLHVLRVQYERVREYYRTHPRARKWTLILGPPFGAVFLLFLVVWIETPSNPLLRITDIADIARRGHAVGATPPSGEIRSTHRIRS